jgi:hypothetical protein
MLLKEYVYTFNLALFQILQRVMDVESKSDPFNRLVPGFENSCLLLKIYTLPFDFNLRSLGHIVNFFLHPVPKIATYQSRFFYNFFPCSSTAQFLALAASMKLCVLFRLLDLGQSAGLPGRVISSSQGLC